MTQARPMTAGGHIIPQSALDVVRAMIGRSDYLFAASGVASVLMQYGVEPFVAECVADRVLQQERRAGRIRWSAKNRGWLVVKGDA